MIYFDNFKLKAVFFILAAFMLGVFTTIAFSFILEDNIHKGTTTFIERTQDSRESNIIARIIGNPDEKPSPYDRITEDKIRVEKDKIIINIENAQWSKFTDTNSMDPVIDIGSNAIQVVPKNENEIHIGDIISYQSDYAEGIIIHRVVEISYDDKGWFCIAKGDNNPSNDPGKIRFNQIKRVVVAIIY
ncbi:MAG: signal peptidase I [Candidatus Woesearchaeota archaeon]